LAARVLLSTGTDAVLSLALTWIALSDASADADLS
jgi:hypothetical protein